jgi:GMP synthase (glutamine-hydrolysing)
MSAPQKKVLLLKPGVTSSRKTLGDYELWFSRTAQAEMRPVELHEGERPPQADEFDAILMAGSPLSVTQPAGWMERAADYMLDAAAHGTPVLGVCFGHQLLAWRLGAKVVKNPLGEELGTVFVGLTEAGRQSGLFAGFPERFDVQATHEDIVLPAPALTVLASNASCEVQAFQAGPRTFGVQFHPEMDSASIGYCIENEAVEAVRAKAVARDTPWGARLLQRFVQMW